MLCPTSIESLAISFFLGHVVSLMCECTMRKNTFRARLDVMCLYSLDYLAGSALSLSLSLPLSLLLLT